MRQLANPRQQRGQRGNMMATMGRGVRQPNLKLRRERELRGWSQDDLADHLCRSAVELGEPNPGVDRNTVGRWERGVRHPQPHYVRLLCNVFQLAADRLGLVAEVPHEPLGPPVDGLAVTAAEPPAVDWDPVKRREFIRLSGLGLAAMAAQGVDFERLAAIPARMNAAHVRYLWASVDRLYAQDQELGGAALVHDALRQYHRTRRILDEADYDERTGAEMMSAAGELAVCVGWLSYDGGDQRLSRQLYSEALLLADQAGDDALGAHVRQNMALQSVQLSLTGAPGMAREAVRLSRRSAELAGRNPSARLHALIAGREAIACAALGDAVGYRGAITRAWRELDRGLGADDPVWLHFVNASEITVHEAKGRAYLDDPSAAAGLFRESLRDPGLLPRNRANYRAQLAAALVRGGDTIGGVHEGLAVLSALEGAVASPRTLWELVTVRSAAERARADEFCARFDHAARSSAI
jgi:transcriptional regulator with XRE-family HTH domain